MGGASQGRGNTRQPGGSGPCSPKADPLGHLVPMEQPPPHAKGCGTVSVMGFEPGLARDRQGCCLHLGYMANGPILGIWVHGPLPPPALGPMPVWDVSKGHLLCLPCHPPGPALTSFCSVSWGVSSPCPRGSATRSTSQALIPVPLSGLQRRLGSQQQPWGGGTCTGF